MVETVDPAVMEGTVPVVPVAVVTEFVLPVELATDNVLVGVAVVPV